MPRKHSALPTSQRQPTHTQATETAIETIEDANAEVDHDQVSQKHFDASNFSVPANYVMSDGSSVEDGQDIIFKRREEIFNNLPNNPVVARKALGAALHTIQDFYSHTNWVQTTWTQANGAVNNSNV